MAILGGKERTDTLDPMAAQIDKANQLIKEAYLSGKKGGLKLARTQDATKIVNEALDISGLVSNPQEASKVRTALVELATHIGNNLEGIDQPVS